uniref:WAP domain-containing protein n=1 Tax=Laticauda laticaudata TaxID=8630 RepID=A0A8C5SKC5_LATLA
MTGHSVQPFGRCPLALLHADLLGNQRVHIVDFKPGECPKVKIDPDYPCNQDCACDSECEGNKKCCPVGCARECFSPEKAGICPQAELERPNGNCTEECQSDAHCEGNQKCCQTGCGTSCWIPDGIPRRLLTIFSLETKIWDWRGQEKGIDLCLMGICI